MKRLLNTIVSLFLALSIYAIDDIIVVNNAQIQCKVKRITDDRVFFVRSDDFNKIERSISISEVKLIQYSDGSIKTFAVAEPQQPETIYVAQEPQQPETIYIAQEPQQPETIYVAQEPQQPETIYVASNNIRNDRVEYTNSNIGVNFDKRKLAIVESFAGVYVFNDNTPVSEYEIIGQVSCSKRGTVTSNVAINPLNGDIATVTSISYSAQYPALRNNLITQAVLANRDVEGIIIKTPREGEAIALMIKFKNKDTNNALARVNVHRGLYVFSDCQPYTEFDGVKRVKANVSLWDCSYDYIRDNILKKAAKKKNINGVIIHLVDGGRDYAETIYIY